MQVDPLPSDHPRVGGGTGGDDPAYVTLRGPSPRGRGNRSETGIYEIVARTIPAWAGEPSDQTLRCSAQGDHPRVGGGTRLGGETETCQAGPSPRGRGNPARLAALDMVAGTIPAWAGEPAPEAKGVCPAKDHPRVGGGTTSN